MTAKERNEVLEAVIAILCWHAARGHAISEAIRAVEKLKEGD